MGNVDSNKQTAGHIDVVKEIPGLFKRDTELGILLNLDMRTTLRAKKVDHVSR